MAATTVDGRRMCVWCGKKTANEHSPNLLLACSNTNITKEYSVDDSLCSRVGSRKQEACGL